MRRVSTDYTESMRKAARLRAEAMRLEHDVRPSGRAGRIWEAVVDCLMLVLLLVLAVDGWLAYRAFHHQPASAGSGSSSVTGAPMNRWRSS